MTVLAIASAFGLVTAGQMIYANALTAQNPQASHADSDTVIVDLQENGLCFSDGLFMDAVTREREVSPNLLGSAPQIISWDASLDTIVTLNRRTRTLALFSLSGGELGRTSLISWGRRLPKLIGVSNGSLAVWDENESRIVMLAPSLVDHEVEVEVPASDAPSRRFIIDRFRNGDLLGKVVQQMSAGSSEYQVASSVTFVRYDRHAAPADTLVTMEGMRQGDLNGVLVPLPLSLDPQAATLEDGLVVLEPTHGSLSWLTPNQRLVYRLDEGRVWEPDEDQKLVLLSRQYSDRVLNDTVLATSLLRLGFPEPIPRFESMFVDSSERIWIRKVSPDRTLTEWIVLTLSERLASHCTVAAAGDAEVLAVERGSVLGVAVTQDGRTWVREYRVRWNPVQ